MSGARRASAPWPSSSTPTRVRSVLVAPLNIRSSAPPSGSPAGRMETAANVLVTVELADGTRGYGEAAPFPAYNGETQAAALELLLQAANWLPGRDAADWKGIAAEFRGRGGAACGSAQCALETALLDAITRRDGALALAALRGRRHRARDGHDGDDRHPGAGRGGGAPDPGARHPGHQGEGRGARRARWRTWRGSRPSSRRRRVRRWSSTATPAIARAEASSSRVGPEGARAITPALLEQWLPKDDLERHARAWAPSPAGPWPPTRAWRRRGRARGSPRPARPTVFNIKLMKAGIAEALEVVVGRAGGGDRPHDRRQRRVDPRDDGLGLLRGRARGIRATPTWTRPSSLPRTRSRGATRWTEAASPWPTSRRATACCPAAFCFERAAPGRICSHAMPSNGALVVCQSGFEGLLAREMEALGLAAAGSRPGLGRMRRAESSLAAPASRRPRSPTRSSRTPITVSGDRVNELAQAIAGALRRRHRGASASRGRGRASSRADRTSPASAGACPPSRRHSTSS